MDNKINAMLGFAAKAGQLLYGLDALAVSKKKVYCVIWDGTLSEKSYAALEELARKKNAPLIKTDALIDDILKKQNCKAVGVTGEQFAKAIINTIKIKGE